MNTYLSELIKEARLRTACVAVMFAVSFPSCGILFEPTDSDPHPPVMTNFQRSPDVVTSGDSISGSFTYVDNGADIEVLEMRDTGGAGSLSPTNPPVTVVDSEGGETTTTSSIFFFPGTTGTIEWYLILDSAQLGVHTIRAWLEDSKGSRSEAVEFVVTVILPGS